MPYAPLVAWLAGALSVTATVATVILTVVEMVAMMLLSKLLAPSPPGSQLSNGATEEYTGTVEPRRIVYGTNLVGGMNAIPPWCHGTNNQMLDQVLVLAGHECNAITDVFINQEKVLSANIGPITASYNDGVVNSGTFANKIWIRRHTGAPTDTVDTILLGAWPSSWDATHIGVGIAKVYVQYQFDTTVFSGGKPEIRCMTQGKKVYDPRIDTTPGANPANPSYMVFSPNPALCAIDYILDPVLGIGESAARIDWVAAVAAANLCDELVAVPLMLPTIPAYDPAHWYSVGDQCQVGGVVYACTVTTLGHAPPNVVYWNPMAVGTAIQRRYSCNTVLDCTQPYDNNLRTIAAAFQGSVLYSSGKWVLLPGHWIAPTFAIADDDVAGAITYNTAKPYTSRYNAVRGQFYDPANLYQPTEYPGIRVSADEIADGEGPVWRELQQAACVDVFEAQRNAIIEQRKSRRKKTWSFPANYGMYAIRPGDFGTLSITELAISLQYVRCTGWQMDGKAMTMLVNLEEVSPTDWYDPAVVVYQTATSLSSPASANFVSDPVGAFTGTGGAGGITFKWTMPSIWHSNLSVELMESDTNNLALATVIWSGVNTGVYIQKGDVALRYYWVRVRNFAGNTTSATNPIGPFAGLEVSATSAQGPPGAPGAPGPPSLVGSLTLEAIVLPADATGHVTSYAGAGGQFVMYLGGTDVTAACQFSLAPSGNLSNLTYTLGGEVMMAGAVTFQAGESITGGGIVIAAGTGAVTTAQGRESVTAVGTGGIVAKFDSTALRFDSSAKRWDQSVGSSGGGGGPVSGTGATSE